jgi:hypothetical protein
VVSVTVEVVAEPGGRGTRGTGHGDEQTTGEGGHDGGGTENGGTSGTLEDAVGHESLS